MLKRIISLILCLAMVLTILPTQTIAQETEEPTEEILETEPTEEETVLPEEESDPTEEAVAPTEATEESTEETTVPTEAVLEPTEEQLELTQLEQEPMLAGDSIIASGEYGENLTWVLDSEGTFMLSGNGDMFFSSYAYSDIPWHSYRSSIRNLIIEEGIAGLGGDEFRDCVNLTSVTIPQSLARMNGEQFNGCTNLTDFYISDILSWVTNCSNYSSAPLSCNIKEKKLYLDGELITDLVIPEGVKNIGNDVFSRCIDLVGVNFPDSVTSIGGGAFSWCEHLRYVDLPSNLTIIDYDAFFNCSSLDTIILPQSLTIIGRNAFEGCESLSEIILPDSVFRIDSYAFSDCGISSIALPQGITWLADGVFSGCNNLKTVSLPDGITEIGGSAFYNCNNLTSITLPLSVTTIGNSAFSGCSTLERIVLPLGITTIERGTFYGCHNLASVSLPEKLTGIYQSAFYECYGLTSIEFPASLTRLDANVFSGCSNLSEITFTGNYPQINAATFTNVTAEVTYPADIATWTSDVLQNYGGTLTWVSSGGTDLPEPTDPVHPTEPSDPTEPVDPTEPPEPTYPTDSTEPIDPTDPPEPTEPTVENRILLDTAEFSGHSSVWIDGAEMSIQKDGDSWYIDLPDGNARVMTTYEYVTDGTSEDGVAEHVRYPVSMQVWTLENQGGAYTATRQTDFDDILQYSGISIRVTGKKGIRMITSIDAASKESLTGAGLAGYTLREYGTAIAWASQLGSSKPLILGKSWVSSNYAYKKDVADPVFRQTNGLMQYTNVLVDFSNEQCADDLAMRPYMILADTDGNEITIYGGIVNRSIGYIALRNRNAFLSDTDPYDFLWDIIHSVYGDAYDADWQPSWTDAIL